MSKRHETLKKEVAPRKKYPLKEAVETALKTATAKFDEAIEVSIKLGIDMKKTDQAVRGTVRMPHGTGKKVRVLVFTRGEKEKEAQSAGADFIGMDDLVAKVLGGWLDFDVAIATPDVMKDLSKTAKILGPRGLMPNPKSGTVTFEVEKAVRDFKAGKIEFKADDSGNVHAGIGKRSFAGAALVENARMFIESVIKVKPSSCKGEYLKSISLSSTMGVGIPVDTKEFVKTTKEE
jgi:large subunit ribosomal protein L1